MPTQQQLNADFQALLESSQWLSASEQEKRDLALAFLQARQGLWEQIGEYIVDILDLVMDAINGNPASVAIADLINGFFDSVLNTVFPWPTSGGGN